MKHIKTICLVATLALLALGCNKTAVVVNSNQTNENSNNTNSSENTNVDPANLVDISTYKVHLDKTGLNVVATAPNSYLPVQNGFTSHGINILSLYLNPSIYKGSNLESAWFNLAINNKFSMNDCYAKPIDDGRTSAYNQTRSVQGNDWLYATPNPLGDAAAGHRGQIETYRLFKNNVCYEVKLGLSEFTRDNLPNPNSVTEADTAKIFGYLGAVFNQLQVQ